MTNPGDAPSRRDFENLSKSVEKLTNTIEQLPARMAELYVRQDVYLRDQALHKQVHGDQRDDIDGLKSARDWVVKIFLAAVFVALTSLVIAGR